MFEDDIIKEIRATREAFAAAHGYDIRKMVETLRALDAAGDWPVVSFPPRPAVPVEPTATPPRVEVAPPADTAPNLA